MNKINCQTCLIFDKGFCRLNPEPYKIVKDDHYCSHHTGWGSYIKGVRYEIDRVRNRQLSMSSTSRQNKIYNCRCLKFFAYNDTESPEFTLLDLDIYKELKADVYAGFKVFVKNDCESCNGTGTEKRVNHD